MEKPVQEMQTAQLLEELRSIYQTIGMKPIGVTLVPLQRRADLLEEEILRRMAW